MLARRSDACQPSANDHSIFDGSQVQLHRADQAGKEVTHRNGTASAQVSK